MASIKEEAAATPAAACCCPDAALGEEGAGLQEESVRAVVVLRLSWGKDARKLRRDEEEASRRIEEENIVMMMMEGADVTPGSGLRRVGRV